jgi:hypothetical protein
MENRRRKELEARARLWHGAFLDPTSVNIPRLLGHPNVLPDRKTYG